jgi:hypothetical protein
MLLPLLFLALIAGRPPGPPRPGTQPHIRQPEARVGDLRVRVTSVLRRRSATTTFSTPAAPAGAGTRLTDYLQVQLEVGGDRPDVGLRVAGVTDDFLALDEGGSPLNLDGPYPLNAGPAGASYGLTVSGPRPIGHQLSLLSGELTLYSRARRVRLEVPWPSGGEDPRATRDGVTGFLKQASHEGTTVSLLLRVETAAGTLAGDEPADFGSDLPVRVLDAKGRPLAAQGQVLYQPAASGPSFREYRLRLTGVDARPARVIVEAVAREGVPKSVPFRLGPIPLPDFSAGDEVLSPGTNPYLESPGGGSIVTLVLAGGQPAGEGVMLWGLSRQDERGDWGPWRWVEVVSEASGQAAMENLKPGRYRVSRRWRPLRHGAAVPVLPIPTTGERFEIQVQRDRQTVLPSLEVGSGR